MPTANNKLDANIVLLEHFIPENRCILTQRGLNDVTVQTKAYSGRDNVGPLGIIAPTVHPDDIDPNIILLNRIAEEIGSPTQAELNEAAHSIPKDKKRRSDVGPFGMTIPVYDMTGS